VILWVALFGASGGTPALGLLDSDCRHHHVDRRTHRLFTLIRDKGAVYTVQATYVATPAAVAIAALFFGGASDLWLGHRLAAHGCAVVEQFRPHHGASCHTAVFLISASSRSRVTGTLYSASFSSCAFGK
jgi:hypothetical protein